jgi:hypothetical protein
MCLDGTLILCPVWCPYTDQIQCQANVPNRFSDTRLVIFPRSLSIWCQVISFPADSSQCQLRRTAVTSSMECQMRCPLVKPKNCHVWWQGNGLVEYQVMCPFTNFMHWQVLWLLFLMEYLRCTKPESLLSASYGTKLKSQYSSNHISQSLFWHSAQLVSKA